MFTFNGKTMYSAEKEFDKQKEELADDINDELSRLKAYMLEMKQYSTSSLALAPLQKDATELWEAVMKNIEDLETEERKSLKEKPSEPAEPGQGFIPL